MIAFRLAVPLIALLVSTARAEEPRKRVLVFPLTGHMSEPPGDAVLPRLTQVVARAAGLTGATVSVSRASFEDGAALAGCAAPEPACLAQVAGALGVDHVVLATVTPSNGGSRIVLYAFVNGELTTREIDLAAGDSDAVVEAMAREAPSVFVGDKTRAATVAPASEPAPDAAVTPPARRADDGGFHAERVAAPAWWLGGGGLVLLGGGATFLVLASGRQDDVDAAPTGSVAELEHLRDLEDEGELYTNLGNGLVVAGGLAVVGAGAWILYSGYQDGERAGQISLRPQLGSGFGLRLDVVLP